MTHEINNEMTYEMVSDNHLTSVLRGGHMDASTSVLTSVLILLLLLRLLLILHRLAAIRDWEFPICTNNGSCNHSY
jgi:hypothetical protein